jgi:hypothetical protein
VKRRPTLLRHVVLAVAAGLVALAGGTGAGAAATAEAADVPPVLTGMTYLNGPFAWVGESAQPVALVQLSGPAAADTVVSVGSSSPAIAQVVGGAVTVLAGQSSAQVLVNTLSKGFVTLSATLGATTVSPAQQLEVAGPTRVPTLEDLTISPTSVAPGGTATVHVTLDFLAPPGGTQLVIGASPVDVVTAPATVDVPMDDYQVSFPVQALDRPGQATITIMLRDVSLSASLSVVEPPADTRPPDTRITAVKVRTAKRKAVVRFTSTEPGSTFECRLDGTAYRACTSPWASPRLKPGRHVFSVRARDAAGNTDTTPAHQAFRVKRHR